MGIFVMAWIVGEGIVIYRTAKTSASPPGPGQLLLTSGVFVILGLMAESSQARKLANTLAWGFDIAAFMNLFAKPPKKTSGSGGVWPPQDLAPNTVIFPTGSGKNEPLISEFKGLASELKLSNDQTAENKTQPAAPAPTQSGNLNKNNDGGSGYLNKSGNSGYLQKPFGRLSK